MKAIVQRVLQAQCMINGNSYSSISSGLLILLGVASEDDETDIEWLAQKIANMRIFSDENNLMNKSVIDIKGEIMVISQFTLFASTKKGNRPGFTEAAAPDFANEMYKKFIVQIQKYISESIQTGIFGADMKITSTNDGPVTIIIDTKNKI
jgi:D-tyrosyl-tRNA(Tyr) deacylase